MSDCCAVTYPRAPRTALSPHPGCHTHSDGRACDSTTPMSWRRWVVVRPVPPADQWQRCIWTDATKQKYKQSNTTKHKIHASNTSTQINPASESHRYTTSATPTAACCTSKVEHTLFHIDSKRRHVRMQACTRAEYYALKINTHTLLPPLPICCHHDDSVPQRCRATGATVT